MKELWKHEFDQNSTLLNPQKMAFWNQGFENFEIPRKYFVIITKWNHETAQHF